MIGEVEIVFVGRGGRIFCSGVCRWRWVGLGRKVWDLGGSFRFGKESYVFGR